MSIPCNHKVLKQQCNPSIKLVVSNNKNIKYLFTLICLLQLFVYETVCFTLQSKIKTQQQYKTSFIPSQQLYAISLTRVASGKQSELQSCHTNPKQITVKSQKQIYRLLESSTLKNREQTIFQKITTLDDDQNIIQEFEIIGNQTFLVTSEGKGYFLQTQTNKVTEVKTLLNLTSGASTYLSYKENQYFNILIRNFKERALIISSNGISLCRSDQANCVLLTQFQPLTYLFNAQIYVEDATTYLFLMAGDSVIIYEITAGNQLKNKQQYGSTFFGVDRVHIRSIYRGPGNQFLILDSRRGILSVTYEDKMSNFQTQKLIYEQPGCYQLTGNKRGDQIVLTCTLAAKSFFLQKLIRSYSFEQPHYEATETIFTNQKIYDTAFVDNFIMSRVYSGVRLYWTSNSVSTPYPYDYNNAGNIFLHNALQSKLKVLQSGQNIIYVSTQDQIRQFTLKALDPYVWCYSLSQIHQQYNVTYSFPCANPTRMQKICESQQQLTYKTWQHGQVKIMTMLIPLALSLIGVFVIGLVVSKVYRRYKEDIERARLKYNTQNEFGM